MGLKERLETEPYKGVEQKWPSLYSKCLGEKLEDIH